MINATYIIPAYGRCYASEQAMRLAWDEGYDFVLLHSGQYCSIRDLPRFNRLETLYLQQFASAICKRLLIKL